MAHRACRVCGCTDDDCSICIERTGEACYWQEADLCSACADLPNGSRVMRCEGCAQVVVQLVTQRAGPGRPELCGGCSAFGPRTHVTAMKITGWLEPDQHDAADAAVAAFVARWGEAAASVRPPPAANDA